MTFESPTSGGRVGLAWLMPRSLAEFTAHRVALECIAEQSCGMIGRSPHHVASTFVSFMVGAHVFRETSRGGAGNICRGAAGNICRADALEDYFGHIHDRDLFLSYFIVNPQTDKSKSATIRSVPGSTRQTPWSSLTT